MGAVRARFLSSLGWAIARSLLPSSLHVALLRKAGARIGRDTTIAMGTLIRASEMTIGESVSIGPGAYVHAHRLSIGDNTRIRPLALCKAFEIATGKCVHVAPTAVINARIEPQARISIGDHSRIFPFCWIEPGASVTIGRHVGVGGHGLIFTHGAWPDYLDGGPVARGPVVIEDEVWLPWRAFILPNVTIGRRAIIAAGSVVHRSIPANVLAGGVPATVIREGAYAELGPEERRQRLGTILDAYDRVERSLGRAPVWRVGTDEAELSAGDLFFALDSPGPDRLDSLRERGLSVLDHPARTAYLTEGSDHRSFIEFIRSYGIRVDVVTVSNPDR